MDKNRHAKRLLGVLAVLGLCAGLLATPALGVIAFEYKVEKAKLAGGASKELKLSGTNKFKLEYTSGGKFINVECNSTKLGEGANNIKGGIPGTAEEGFTFGECKGKIQGANCATTTAKTNRLEGELVEVTGPIGSPYKGYVATLFKPKEKNGFGEIVMLKCGEIAKLSVLFTGTIAAAMAPTLLETKAVWFEFPPARVGEVTNIKKEVEKPLLLAEGATLIFEGVPEELITKEEKWNGF